MKHIKELGFTINILKKLHIKSSLINLSKSNLPSSIDLGLRAMLFGQEDYSKLLANSPMQAKSNTIYRFFDEYQCNYLFFKLPSRESDSFFFVGPYISKLPSNEFITKKSKNLSLTEYQKQLFTNYYRNLPIIEDENVIISIIDTLGAVVFGCADNFNFEFIDYEIPDNRRPVYLSSLFDCCEQKNVKLDLDIIESNYQNENLLIDAVSKGKLNKVDIIANSVLNQGTENRVQDSLRNRKNYLIILNTLLRKSAEYGAVHPYHIHLLSSSFAKQIEELHSIDSSLTLQKNMIRKYCQLVKEHSLKQYSRLIGKVITIISHDLTATLTLKSIAYELNVNASYLSALFKKECGETLTDYVNRKRMENASYLLTHSSKQIQTISEECGILDANYFIKLFKKHYSLTPTQYRANLIK